MVDYLFLALLVIIFSSSHISSAEWNGTGSRWTELFLHTKGFDFKPGRKQYKLERKPLSGGKWSLAISSIVILNSEQTPPPASLPNRADTRVHPWSVPLSTQHTTLLTQGTLVSL